ncbi:MarR family winged helix-turn-helix transcriptional regulator [Spirosoma aerolatum]|uniref:MarR family winged helix-turn-helix transcriptional regulator n=1 Tax=Spirosoma aerolatum TaxID=1211326 RepID=UPI0009AE909D|nr:MarR family winged helix-turn-helix transcriptional regulator [Spirosoma aerolatum]
MERGEKALIDLVNSWATYSEVTPNADLGGFCLHYLTEHAHQPMVNEQQPVMAINELNYRQQANSINPPFMQIRPESRLAALVGRLSKYSYFYSKKAMQPLQFKGIDDPVYLLVLMKMGTPKKSELIYEMMSEFASGIDIVNRLVSMGLIEEFPDEEDRRSKRLRITLKGIEALHECFPVMNKVADVAFSSLTEGEKALLVQLLDKLDRYHAEHYRQSRNAEFDAVYEQMVGSESIG